MKSVLGSATASGSFRREVAGMPIATERGGTSRTTTAFAPTAESSPIVMGPSIFAPAPSMT